MQLRKRRHRWGCVGGGKTVAALGGSVEVSRRVKMPFQWIIFYNEKDTWSVTKKYSKCQFLKRYVTGKYFKGQFKNKIRGP